MKKLNSLLLVSTLGVSLFAGLASFAKKSTPQPVEAGEAVPTMTITVLPKDLNNKGTWDTSWDNKARSGTTTTGITFSVDKGRLNIGDPGQKDAFYTYGGTAFTVSSAKYTFLKVIFTLNADWQHSDNNDYWNFLDNAFDGENVNMESHRINSTNGYWQEETPKNSVKLKSIGKANHLSIEKIVLTVIAPTYTVTYDANGGSGETVDPTEWVEDTNATLIASSFTAPEGKIFSHWNTKADGTGTSYSVGQQVKMTSNLTLYAQYAKPMAYTFNTYSGDYDGKPHNASVTVTDPAEGAVIKYGTSASSVTLSECPQFTEVGEHTVWYKITASDYAEVVSSFVITINENDKTTLNKAIESGNKVHELIRDKYTELDASLVTALTEGTTCKEDTHALPAEIAEKADAINAAVVKAVEAVINDIGEVKANDEQSKQKVESARQVYNSLSEEQKALVPAHTLATLEAAEKAVSPQGLGAGAIIGIVLGCLVVVLALLYVLAFFVFNRWIAKDGKAIRVFVLGHKEGKARTFVFPCKVEYHSDEEIFKSKSEALKNRK